MKTAPIHTEYRYTKILSLWLCMIFAIINAAGATFLPVVTNFGARQYSGQLQNWGATQMPDGTICVANNDGVLTFDGYTWRKYRVPGNHIVRSVMADGERLYVGSFEQCGYFEAGADGHWRYSSISDTLPAGTLNDDEFWNIVKLKGTIYFQSFENIMAYEPANHRASLLSKKFTDKTRSGSMRPLYIFNHRDRLKAQEIGGGLYTFTRHGWHRTSTMEDSGSGIVAILGDLAVTEFDGLKRIMPDGTLLPFPTEVDASLRRDQTNRAATNRRGDIFIGTISGGVYALDRTGRLIWHISSNSGRLGNNSVLGLFVDRQENLWVCLDDGISLIHTGKPYTTLQPEAGFEDIGMVYGVGRATDGRLIVAANQGAYGFNDHAPGNFILIPGTRGQNWCVRQFDGQTFIGNNIHTYELMPDGTTSIVAGTATDMKSGMIHNNRVIVQSSYYTMNIYTRPDGRWRMHNEVKGFGAPVRQVEISPDGTIWTTHMTRGVIRTRLNAALDSVIESQNFLSLAGDSIPRMCYILNIRGNVLFTDDSHFYSYDESDKRFTVNAEYDSIFHWINKPRRATHIDDNHFWIAAAEAYYLIRHENGTYKNLLTISLDNFPRAINDLVAGVFSDSNSISYFNLNGGIGRIDIRDLAQDANDFKPTLRIGSVGYNSPADGFIELPLVVNGSSPLAENGNLHITLSYPEFSHHPLRYRFTLKGNGHTRDSVTTVPELGYPNLAPGSYSLHCEVLDENSDILDSVDYSFKVPRPWVLSWWAIVIYVLLIAGSVMLAMRFYTRRRLNDVRRKIAEERTLHDAEIHKQQLVIAEQQKQILEKELTEKGKELASMDLDAYSRQQVIDQLRELLNDARGKGVSNAGTVKALSARLQELSTREGGGGEFWSMFEQNFDLIHEHFFRNLRRQFPNLTSGDLRLCVLIRMNLSTKDIARFQGLTVRGIETARYRLRKKLGLGPDASITDFLIDFGDDDASRQPD